MRHVFALLVTFAIGIAWTSAFLPRASMAQATLQVDHQHDFDFEFGNWKADVRILQHPFVGSHNYVAFLGTSDVRKIWDGRGNYGELEIRNAATHVEGLTLRLYDPKSHLWHVYFANSGGGTLGVPAVGQFNNGVGTFYDTEQIAGRTTHVRFVFSDITSTAFKFVQSFSTDHGTTWEREWISTFSRLAS